MLFAVYSLDTVACPVCLIRGPGATCLGMAPPPTVGKTLHSNQDSRKRSTDSLRGQADGGSSSIGMLSFQTTLTVPSSQNTNQHKNSSVTCLISAVEPKTKQKSLLCFAFLLLFLHACAHVGVHLCLSRGMRVEARGHRASSSGVLATPSETETHRPGAIQCWAGT